MKCKWQVLEHFPQAVCRKERLTEGVFDGWVFCIYAGMIDKKPFGRPIVRAANSRIAWEKIYESIVASGIIEMPHCFSLELPICDKIALLNQGASP